MDVVALWVAINKHYRDRLRSALIGVNRRGVRPTIGVQCGPTAAADKPFVDNSKMPPSVGPSWAPMWAQSSRPIYSRDPA
jgi:hypothetical protein